jgi:uncharacterized protein
MKKKVWKWARIIVPIYIACGIALYYFQETFLFHPKSLPPDHVYTFSQPYKEVNIPVSDEKNIGIVQFTVPDSVRKGVVLYFHGNRRNIERYAPFAIHFTRNNYEVWMIDYPGFGKSTGNRTEQIMYADAQEFYKLAKAKFSEDSIILYGKSMGTGLATYIASRYDCKQLILETPYYSIDALMRRYAFMYPVSWLSKYHFPTYEYFENVDAPITMLHGTDDWIIPFKHSKWLQKLKPGVKLVAIEDGSHNDLNKFPLFQATLDSLLK